MASRERSCMPHALVAIALCALATGCVGKDEGAERQYRRTLDALQGGSLVDAYASFMPSSYDRDLNDVIAKAKSLIGEEELAVVRNLVTKAVNGVSVVFSTLGQKDPAMAGLGGRLKELPGALGLESIDSFQRLDARGLLAAADKTFFRDLVKVKDVRSKIASVKVSVIEERGDWAKVRFSLREGQGDPTGEREEVVELIRQEGKWVPASWVAEWPRQMQSLRAEIDGLAKAKAKNPRAVLESLSVVAAVLEEPGKIMEAIVGGMGGGKPAGSRP